MYWACRTSLLTEVVAAAAACASREVVWMALERRLMRGAASGLASTSAAASCTERRPTSARMHTISSAARSPCRRSAVSIAVLRSDLLGAAPGLCAAASCLARVRRHTGILVKAI